MLSNIRNSKITPYKNINLGDLKEAVSSIFKNSSEPRRIVMYTGEVGMWNLNWLLVFGGMLECKYTSHNFKKLKSFYYFSLFNKSGLYKLKVTGRKFEFFKDVTLIHTINDVTNIWTVNSGDIFSQETKNKLKEVNNYIKYLENHG